LQAGIVGTWGAPLIARERLTIAGLLKQQGYQTACIGKWHLGWEWPIPEGKRPLFQGNKDVDISPTSEQLAVWRETFSRPIEGGPITRGFDSYFGTDVPNWPPYCFIEQNRTLGIPTEFLPTRLLRDNQASVPGPALANWKLEPILPALAERASAFITGAAKEEKPFFLYLPLTAPHTPLAVNSTWQGRSGLNAYADLVMETDAAVGRVLEALDQTGQADNTLVLFTSDNGCAPYIGVADLEQKGHYPSGPLRGYKSDAWEGGHRVPLVVRWPRVVRGASVCDQLVHQADVMATCAEVLGVKLPEDAGEDSISLLPLLRGSQQAVRESAISTSSGGLFSVRRGTWKLIFGPGSGGWSKGSDEQPAQLFNLADDLGETRNMYNTRPEVVAELTSLMERLVNSGRSTPGGGGQNDVPVAWKRFLKP
jgi:arylsulfatase A-like enzyme